MNVLFSPVVIAPSLSLEGPLEISCARCLVLKIISARTFNAIGRQNCSERAKKSTCSSLTDAYGKQHVAPESTLAWNEPYNGLPVFFRGGQWNYGVTRRTTTNSENKQIRARSIHTAAIIPNFYSLYIYLYQCVGRHAGWGRAIIPVTFPLPTGSSCLAPRLIFKERPH